jgi:hypothetical protein
VKRMSLFTLASTVFLVACASSQKYGETAAPAIPKDPDRIECRSGDDIRLLEVEHKPVGCAFYYSKSGRRDRIAASTMGPQECVNSMHDVRKNLATSGYTCAEMELKTEAPPASPATPE